MQLRVDQLKAGDKVDFIDEDEYMTVSMLVPLGQDAYRVVFECGADYYANAWSMVEVGT